MQGPAPTQPGDGRRTIGKSSVRWRTRPEPAASRR